MKLNIYSEDEEHWINKCDIYVIECALASYSYFVSVAYNVKSLWILFDNLNHITIGREIQDSSKTAPCNSWLIFSWEENVSDQLQNIQTQMDMTKRVSANSASGGALVADKVLWLSTSCNVSVNEPQLHIAEALLISVLLWWKQNV